jgi:hypothetical protein
MTFTNGVRSESHSQRTSAYIFASLVNPKNGRAAPMISEETYQAVMDNREVLDSAIIYDRDFAYNYVRPLDVHIPAAC